jgi:L-threonylcarbamoyladenylate synthase
VTGAEGGAAVAGTAVDGAGADAFSRCLAAGGVAVFPADTVYGLACAPDAPAAVQRLFALKGRPPEKPAAVMFFAPEPALAALPELGPRTCALLRRLLPGGITALLPNPERRFPLACTRDPLTLGLRVPALPEPIAALRTVPGAVLQSSANIAGGPDARRLREVPEAIRAGADLVLDGGELPGTPSTVVDLRRYEAEGEWAIVRAGAVPEAVVARAAG